MVDVKPWEEVPDDGYWRALLGGDSTEKPIAPTPNPPAPAVARAEDDKLPSVGWILAEKSYTQGDTLELRVVGYNRGGLLVDLNGIHGFVPASQLTSFPRKAQEDERMQELARFVNRSLHVKVIELDRARNRLILSERVANPIVPRADQVIATIQPEQIRRGIIRNITDFGAFVDLGGVEGLIHISEFSWQRVEHPRDMLSPGQEVQVYIMDVNREQKRIACSLKRLVPNPWAEIAQKLQPGDWIDGVVTNIVSFGAFVRIAEGVEGLIHISELAEGSFLHPHDVVQEGQPVRARVVNVDARRQRIGLSLRDGRSPRADQERMASETADQPPPPLPPDAAYWESLAQSGI